MSLRKKVGEVQDYKERKRRQREIHNLEERMLLDELTETDRRRQAAGGRENRDRLHLSKDKNVRQLQIEYERLREKGMLRRNEPFGARRRNWPVFSSIPDNSNDPPRYNPRQDPKIQQLAESHGRQMEFLHNRNRELERQREEIRRRLEELGHRPPKEDHSTEELLRELKEQEARNQRLLDELKQQLLEARRSVNIVKTEPERQTKSYIYPIYYGNSLVAEIVAVRQAYLQNGGNDPDILAQLAQMQAEAQAIDDSMKNAQKKGKDRKDGVPSNLLTLELENERLQRQLLLLQEQKIVSINRRKDNREDELDQEIRRLHRDHLQKMYQLQREIERLRQESLLDRMRFEMQAPPPTKIILQQQGPQQPQRAYVDLEQTVPYDQYSSPRRVNAYGHTWVHTQHRQDVEGDPYFDLDL